MSGTPGDVPPEVLANLVFFGPDTNCTLDLCPVEWTVYGYRPSLAANGTFLGLYVLSAIIHIYLGMRWKAWFFMTCMVLGAVNAVIGYAGRIAMYFNPFNFTAFIIQIICVTSDPVYYSASIYVTLAAAIKYFSPSLSRFQPKYFYYVLIPSDVVCLILQAAGGALSTVSQGVSQQGVDLALAGLSLQVFCMVAFCCFFGDYLIRYFRSDIYHSQREGLGVRPKLFFGFMATAILLILARCSYRLAELHNGYMGELIRDEALFIGLEGVMIILAVFCLMIGHPGFAFKDNNKQQGSDELELTDVDKGTNGK